jgi:hypothetical protein
VLICSLDKISHERKSLVSRVLALLYDLVEDFRDGKAMCQSNCALECELMLFGALLQQMHQHGFPQCQPQAEDFTLSFIQIVEAVEKFQSPDCLCGDVPADESELGRRKKAIGWKQRRRESLDPGFKRTASQCIYVLFTAFWAQEFNSYRLQ